LEAPGVPRVGRFGWKSILPTILSFSADAARNELGLTNRLLPDELDPNGDMPPSLDDPDFCDLVADPEDGPEDDVPGAPHFIDRVTDFQRFMSAPPQTPRSGMSGEAIFETIGCAQCHHPTFTTSDDPSLELVLRNQVIHPYSDFLLHDMGDAGDDYPEGDALGSEVRTTPLWGLRHREELWHDGRFDDSFEENVVNAIIEHGDTGSEAVAVVNAWNDLTDEERDSVVAFLGSLGHLEFDHDHDNKIDFADFLAFAECFTGPGVFYDADDPCAVSDIDQDGDVDEDDFDSFLVAYLDEGLGPQDDCNENGVIDLADIITGTSLDEDSDGIPDDCETTPILELVLTPSGTYLPGDTVEVTLWMRELGVYEAVAFQAFLGFDETQMSFVSGEYSETPFGLPILTPIVATDGAIDLSAGTDPLGGQTATSADGALVVLTFEANEVFCLPGVWFRVTTPPTRISLDDGTAADPIILLDLQPPACPTDLNGDDDVGYFDLVTVLASWGPCTTTCAGDVNCDQEVGFGDLLTILASWGPCD
ncbi:MAG: hypothetical protein HKO59_11855, partial [Phycisphaerales bacterium]|nr:hypothetical protein [Phycisphaerales bacterium]